MRVGEMMTKRVETVPGNESVENALRRMRARRLRHLVVTLGTEVVGVVSERDLETRAADRPHPMVADVMSAPVAAAEPHTTIRQAANLLRGRTIGCLPVMEKGKLVGIVTATDLLELIGRGSERPVSRTKRWVMKSRGPRARRVTAG